jgi:hypothetical protein
MNREVPMDKAQHLYAKAIRCKGFSITAAASGVTTENLDLSGEAREFVGIALRGAADTTRLQLVINNDVVIEDTAAGFFDTSNDNSRMLTPFERPLTGRDDITLRSTNDAGAANPFEVVLYYRNLCTLD